MQTINVILDDGAYMPERAHDADAGMDLRTPERVVIPPRMSATVDTGVHMEIPFGYAGVLISKSGLNVKSNITSTGLIDSGYTGSIRVKLYNHGNDWKTLEEGDKISQIMIVPVVPCTPVRVDAFAESERGAGGFGSTGR